jgi:hypothetical protein
MICVVLRSLPSMYSYPFLPDQYLHSCPLISSTYIFHPTIQSISLQPPPLTPQSPIPIPQIKLTSHREGQERKRRKMKKKTHTSKHPSHIQHLNPLQRQNLLYFSCSSQTPHRRIYPRSSTLSREHRYPTTHTEKLKFRWHLELLSLSIVVMVVVVLVAIVHKRGSQGGLNGIDQQVKMIRDKGRI